MTEIFRVSSSAGKPELSLGLEGSLLFQFCGNPAGYTICRIQHSIERGIKQVVTDKEQMRVFDRLWLVPQIQPSRLLATGHGTDGSEPPMHVSLQQQFISLSLSVGQCFNGFANKLIIGELTELDCGIPCEQPAQNAANRIRLPGRFIIEAAAPPSVEHAPRIRQPVAPEWSAKQQCHSKIMRGMIKLTQMPLHSIRQTHACELN